jgi:CheY-like chemotaxis protein
MDNKLYHRQTILCIDDDADDLQLLKEAIETIDASFIILQAQNGEEGLAQLKKLKAQNTLPCLIILDINMPKMDGRQTFQLIRADDGLASVPVVIFSTSSSPMDKMFFTKKDVEYFTKPISFQEFTDAAKKLLQSCKQAK